MLLNFRPVFKNDLLCLLSVGYNQFVLTFNRSIPVVISVFRYIYIFHWTSVISDKQKKHLRTKCYVYLFVTSAFAAVLSMMNTGITKRYNRCMGKEEQYYFNIAFFLDEPIGGPLYKLPVWHPYRLVIMCLYYFYIVLVPYAYIKIFMFRKNQRTKGLAEKDNMTWKRRNIVSTGYNMVVWLVEGLVMLMVSSISKISLFPHIYLFSDYCTRKSFW